MPVGVSAYVPLANVTLGSAQQTIKFASINQSFRDLVLIFNGSLINSGSLIIRFNEDSGTNFSTVDMYGTGSGTGSGSSSFTGIALFGRSFSITNNQQIMATANIMDYSATDKHKTSINRGSSAGQLVEASAGRWANTAAITTVEVQNIAGTFAIGSSFALYGIAS